MQPRARGEGDGSGFFDNLIINVDGTAKDGIPRADSTLEKLAKLKPAFDRSQRPGHVTAGNASPLTDGAAAIWVAPKTGSASCRATRARRSWSITRSPAVDISRKDC